jgi:Uma2 family endonuclease
MAAPASKRMTVREFLDWETRQPQRYEFTGGAARLMAGGTRDHSTAKLNIASAFRTRLRGGPCRAFDSDLKVRTALGEVYYPDVTIDCGPGSGADTEASRPVVVVEVLSPSTRKRDLEVKLLHYQATPSILEIVFVELDRMHVMIWRRGEDGWMEAEIAHPEASLDLESVGASVPLLEVYAEVTFEG